MQLLSPGELVNTAALPPHSLRFKTMREIPPTFPLESLMDELYDALSRYSISHTIPHFLLAHTVSFHSIKGGKTQLSHVTSVVSKFDPLR